MTQIACRWPGGMDIAVPINGVVRKIRLNGPPAAPRPSFSLASPPPRRSAQQLFDQVADTVEDLKDTKDTFTSLDYAVTEVPGDFWQSWLAANREFDAVKDKFVFALPMN